MMERGLYAILDPAISGGRSLVELAEAVLSGGCAVLQLRAKQLSDRESVELARALKARCVSHRVPFVMNDRVDLARIVDADGVHLGQDDLPIDVVRPLLGDMWIGISTHTLTQAIAAEKAGAAMIGFGPVFPTTSKENPDPTVGVTRLREVAGSVNIPVAAIGGVTSGNVHDVATSGAAYAAVISALSTADSPEATARELHRAMRGER